MRIKRLDIVGFKSFPDKATLSFDKPIVGIVGPNGCGKSNIVDAIRWSMGEQSVKALRGRTREDVIFAGTESRAPTGMAEVTLTFDNTEGNAPPQYAEYAEIAVTRRLYRSGDSEYEINRSPCRLRDITDLFLGTGAGNKAYSIIEQGHVARILQAKPEERRLIIEEAAGITKYHARKREAERKIRSTRLNLQRIEDIIKELKRQLDSLSRQAKKAERYRDYKGRLKELDLRLASHQYSGILDRLNELGGRIEDLQQQEAAQTANLSSHENDMKTRQLALIEKEQTLTEQQETLHLIDRQIRLDERNIEVYTEESQRIGDRAGEIGEESTELTEALAQQKTLVDELEADQKKALLEAQSIETELEAARVQQRKINDAFSREQSEIDTLKRGIFDAMGEADRCGHQMETLKHRIDDNDERTVRNRAERGELETLHEEFDSQRREFLDALGGLKQLKLQLDTKRTEQSDTLKRNREAYVDVEERLIAERDSLTAVRSRLDSLSELDRALEGFADAVKLLLANEQNHFDKYEMIDVLARRIQVDPKHEPAVAAVLGERLQWVLVADREAALKGVEFLSNAESGRAGLLPSDTTAPADSVNPPEGAVALSDFVETDEDSRNAVERLLHGVLFVDDLDTACRMHDECSGAFSFVTAKGEVVDKSGALLGGAGESRSQSLLQRRREMEDLADRQKKLEALCEQLTMQRDERVAAIKDLEQDLESSLQDSHRQELKIIEQEKDLNRLESEIERHRRRMEQLDRELRSYQDEMGGLQEELRNQQAKREKAKLERDRLESELRGSQSSLAKLAEKREEANADITRREVGFARASQRRQHLDSELSMARARRQDLGGRLERLDFEKSRSGDRKEELRKLCEATKSALGDRIEKQRVQKAALDVKRDEFSTEQIAIQEMDNELRAMRQKLESIRETLSQSRLDRSEQELKATHIEQRIEENYEEKLSSIFRQHLTEEAPGQDEKEEIEGLKRKIHYMGEVNLAAIGEHDRVSERYQFLLDQQEDLEESLTRLEDAINKINRTTRRRFRETFEEVNRGFSDLFPKLFEGGEARLEFTEPGDLLTTGVEIVARPPGKKLQSVNLLSGGEKALTALSLVFAIFLYRPTPFCLLDEVDAPLDDINIARFNLAVRRISAISQFILITHNKKTMEITNTLYGVTMEEPGISKLVSVNLT